jgi:hypothetical protein
MSNQYEVLNPWAEVDPVPLKHITPRLDSLSIKTIGLYCNFKESAKQILSVMEKALRARYPDSKFTWYHNEMMGTADLESERREKIEDWIRSVDAVVLAVGD